MFITGLSWVKAPFLFETFFKSYTEKVWGITLCKNRGGLGKSAHQGSRFSVTR